MDDQFLTRTRKLRQGLEAEGIGLALLTHPDTVYYFTGYWGDLEVEFGRPTVAAVPRDGDPVLITAAMETEMARALTWIGDVRG